MRDSILVYKIRDKLTFLLLKTFNLLISCIFPQRKGLQLIDGTDCVTQRIWQLSYHKQGRINSRLAIKMTYLVQPLHHILHAVEGVKLSSLCFVLYLSSLALYSSFTIDFE